MKNLEGMYDWTLLYGHRCMASLPGWKGARG